MAENSALTGRELLHAASQCWPMAEVVQADRREFGRALIHQGYTPDRAAELATDLPYSDGALQMLARHRIAAAAGRLLDGVQHDGAPT